MIMYGFNSFYVHLYIFYILYVTLVCCCFKQLKYKKHKIVLLGLPLVFLSSLRGDTVGGDLENYLPNFDAYYYINNLKDLLGYNSHEPGYVLFTKLISLLYPSHRFYLIVTSICTLIGPFYLIYKYSKMPGLSFLIYYSLGFYTNTMNNIRQSLAISICCFAIPFLFKREFRQFVFIVLLATVFHYSAFTFIFIGLFH